MGKNNIGFSTGGLEPKKGSQVFYIGLWAGGKNQSHMIKCILAYNCVEIND